MANYPTSITDDFAYFAGWEPGLGYRWPICDFQHRVELSLRLGGRWAAVNDNLFIVNAHSGRSGNAGVQVISADGQVKFQSALRKDESAGSLRAPIRSSEVGNRIAVDVFKVRGWNRALDISGHVTERRIAVYDIATGKELVSVPVNTKHRFDFEFDLNPDGRRLAILEDGVVKVVDLD